MPTTPLTGTPPSGSAVKIARASGECTDAFMPALEGARVYCAFGPSGPSGSFATEAIGDCGAEVNGLCDAPLGKPDRGVGGVENDEFMALEWLINIDFVPSISRPPRGGPFEVLIDAAAEVGRCGIESLRAKLDADGEGEEGPAPGD